ncbi:MAG: DUF4124 domain-containing protein [Methylophaga sp.]|nr:DUF4124 domain-containing protein [Methylophaga sp.]
MLQIMKFTALSLLLFLLPVHAEIYRWVDESGNVVFSDEPQPGAETVDLPPATTYTPAEDEAVTDDILKLSPDDDEQATQETQAPDYQIRIVAPGNDESIWVNNGDVTVSMIVEPALDTERGDKVLLHLDGEPVAEPRASTTFQLNNLSRGTHNLNAMVVDSNGMTLTSTGSVTFHLHRASIQNNPGLTPPGPTGGKPTPNNN